MRFAICIASQEDEELEVWLWIIDESGEGYLYPQHQFVIVTG